MIRRLALTAALVAILAAPAAAQSIWLDRTHRPSVLAEVYFPSFDGADSHFPTWTWFVATRLPLSSTVSFVGELPYASGKFGTAPFEESDATIGNPYLGIEVAPDPTGVRLELGVRAPLASEDKVIPFIVGYFTDVDREEAFIPNRVAARLGIHYHHAPDADSHMAYDVRFVPSVWFPTDNAEDTETFLGYGGTVRYEGEEVRVGGGLTGRWNVSNDGGDFGSNSVHQFEVAADFLRGSVRPGIQLKLPLDDDLTSVLDTVWGVNVTILP
jgi:hypothetical protein